MTATYTAAVPPLAKLSMIGTWIETVLYGVNCVMYTHCMYILLCDRSALSRRRLLPVMITMLFVLCTAHIGAALRQLLDAFVYAPSDIPNYSTTYWLNFTLAPRVVKGILCGTLILLKDFIQIWRLYVVFMYNWRIIILPIILLAGSLGSAYAASIVPVLPSHGGSVIAALVISASSLSASLNLFLTASIVARLWGTSRKIASLTGIPTNRYAYTMYIVIESGAISAGFSTAIAVLFALGSYAALTVLDIVAQMDVLVSLLIVVQVQVRKTRQRPSAEADSSANLGGQDKMVFTLGISRDEGSLRDISYHAGA